MKIKDNKNFLNFLAFLSFIIIAILIILTGLDSLGIHLFGTTLMALLETIRNVCVLLVVGLLSYKHVKGGKKFLKILYIIAVAVFIAGTVMIWL